MRLEQRERGGGAGGEGEVGRGRGRSRRALWATGKGQVTEGRVGHREGFGL